MSKLDLLAPDLSRMSDEELRALVRTIRDDRKVSKRPQRTQTKGTRIKKADAAKAMLAGLSPADRAELLKGLKK